MGKGSEKDWESKCIWNQKMMVRKKRKLLKRTWIWYVNHVKVSECFTWWRVLTYREESFTPHAQETTFYSWSWGMWPLSYGQSAEAIYSWDWLYMFNDYLSLTLTHFVDCHFLIVIPLGWSLFIFGHPLKLNLWARWKQLLMWGWDKALSAKYCNHKGHAQKSKTARC